jgi:hypothetical protein
VIEAAIRPGFRRNAKRPPVLRLTVAFTLRFTPLFKLFAYFGYLNSGAAFSASLVVFIDASHLSFFWS